MFSAMAYVDEAQENLKRLAAPDLRRYNKALLMDKLLALLLICRRARR
jgi:hypothetical protein